MTLIKTIYVSCLLGWLCLGSLYVLEKPPDKKLKLIIPKPYTLKVGKTAHFPWIDNLQRIRKDPNILSLQPIQDISLSDFKTHNQGNDKDIIGTIKLNRLHIKLNIYGTTTNSNATQGVISWIKTREIGGANLVLIGHSAPQRINDDNILLNHMKYATENDIIKLTNGKHSYTYQVVDKFKTHAKDFDIIQVDFNKNYDHQPIMTLITCVDGQSDKGREVLVAKLINKK